MRESEWLYTKLDCVHEAIGDLFELDSGEQPLVSCFIDSSNWYVMSTRKFAGVADGKAFTVDPVTAVEWTWGNFKHQGRAKLESVRVVRADRTSIDVLYETGYASMGPIHYQRFWELKYPILDKLAI